jgi:hypothetical protein
MTRQSWQEWIFIVLNNNTIYCSIIFANHIEKYKIYKWNHFPAKLTNTKLTAWLQTPAERRLCQTPP